jgi:hypothetical protein
MPRMPGACCSSRGRFDIGSSGQQVHIAFGESGPKSSRHPCFKIESPEALLELRQRVWDHHKKGDEAAPQEADEPGKMDSGEFQCQTVLSCAYSCTELNSLCRFARR